MSPPEVHFIEVKTAAEKKEALIGSITEQFEKGVKQLILLPTKEAVVYMDQLLWSEPLFSFLPHSCAEDLSEEEQIKERVLLSAGCRENLNRAEVVVNLGNEVVFWAAFASQPKLIIELIDHTHPERQQRAASHRAIYEQQGCMSFVIKNWHK